MAVSETDSTSIKIAESENYSKFNCIKQLSFSQTITRKFLFSKGIIQIEQETPENRLKLSGRYDECARKDFNFRFEEEFLHFFLEDSRSGVHLAIPDLVRVNLTCAE
jgi:hypothetical protein